MACISIASSQKKCITLHFLSDDWISLTALFGLASRRIFTSKDASFTSQCRGVQPFFYNCGDVWAIWKLRANSELPSVQIIQALVTSELTCDCWAVWNTSNFENSNKCSSPKTKKTLKTRREMLDWIGSYSYCLHEMLPSREPTDLYLDDATDMTTPIFILAPVVIEDAKNRPWRVIQRCRCNYESTYSCEKLVGVLFLSMCFASWMWYFWNDFVACSCCWTWLKLKRAVTFTSGVGGKERLEK